jgi:hypothetical protein
MAYTVITLCNIRMEFDTKINIDKENEIESLSSVFDISHHKKDYTSTKDIESVEIIIIISNKRQHHRMRKEVIYRNSGEP